jgi:dTDP-4-amino-4,6-dideoxygalactose transaminase
MIDQDDIRAVSEVLASGNIALGEKVEEFENKLAQLIGAKHAVACSSGTSALHLALLGLGLGVGDEVVVPSYVCSSPYHATLHASAVPKVVDVDLSDFNVCAETVKQQLSSKTKALIVPHIFGMPAELDKLLELGIPIIEDCAQSLGAEYKGRKVGCWGELAIFSFYATKMITTGEGGMVLTNNSEFYSRMNDARDCDNKPPIPTRYNYKMTDFQASLGLSQLKKLQWFVERRRQIASLYTDKFSQYDITVPREFSDRKSVFFRYVVLVEKLGHVQKNAKERGVMCERPIWKPLHKSLPGIACPNSDYAYDHALSLPLYPSLSEEEVQYLVENLEIIFREMK